MILLKADIFYAACRFYDAILAISTSEIPALIPQSQTKQEEKTYLVSCDHDQERSKVYESRKKNKQIQTARRDERHR